ncbi:cyclophilin-like fold protein [Pontibacter sp. E15-1]|uniref:cyclophilin-like fold protein n=1 Tax=Pontibacter sp. E15-1 TaxID=2919918 RepID=UPI001F4F6980|nr:cyclophilin-like fold protein [Pontibacter sp. E15-1]MCJ8167143.1 cyclophilin-like fold protein [Pontibacter sp. E15-1]
MKHLLILLISVVSLNVPGACKEDKIVNTVTGDIPDDPVKNTTGNQMKIIIGSKTFEATLVDNEAVTALKGMLPLTLDMSELNGNEKLFRLQKNLPEKASNPGTIQAGDLMLWGSNTLVLFYEAFPTSYSYTRIGRINDPAGLAQAVGSGSVKVTFEIE